MLSVNVSVLHHCLDTAINGFALLLNCYLAHLILAHSTRYVKVYRRVLLTTCVSDILLSLIAFLGQPVCFPSDGYLVIFSNGFFGYGSPTVDFLASFGLCAGLHANVVFLVVQFWYRYSYVCKSGYAKEPSNVVLFLVPSAWCVVQAAITAWLYTVPSDFQEISIAILESLQWPFAKERPPHPVGAYWSESKFFLYTACYAISAGGGYLLMIWCEWKIVAHLRRLESSIHETTKSMHADVHRALIALAVGPFVTAIVPIAYFLTAIATQSSPGVGAAFATSVATTITLLNPVTTIYFIRPYREATKRAFGWRKQSAVRPAASATAACLSVVNTSVRQTF